MTNKTYMARGYLPGMAQLVEAMTNKGADNMSDPMDWAAGRAKEKGMTQPNEQLIETIRQALDAATQGRWIVQPGEHYDAVYSSDETKLTVVSARSLTNDARLIANAPTWLRFLLEENKRLRRIADAKFISINKGDEEDRYALQEEVIRLTEENKRLERQEKENQTMYRRNFAVLESQLQQTKEQLDRKEREHEELLEWSMKRKYELEETRKDLGRWKTLTLERDGRIENMQKELEQVKAELERAYAEIEKVPEASYPPREKGATE